jgi:hypothetical protein
MIGENSTTLGVSMFRFVVALASLLILVGAGCSDDQDNGSGFDLVEPDASSDAAETSPDTSYTRECQQGDYVWDDYMCQSSGECELMGDEECYARCETDADCTEPARPQCVNLALFDDGDFEGNACVDVCMADDVVSTC